MKMLNKNLFLYCGVALLLAAVFLPMCLFRVIDGDEGYYLYAAKLVTDLKIPYIDFFYTQMPLLPYIYALWFKVLGITWAAARIFSGIIALLIGLLLLINTKK